MSEEERLRLGVQQAALLAIQEAEALKRQQALLDEEHQRQMLLAQQKQQEQQRMLQALNQREADQFALLERQAEEQANLAAVPPQPPQPPPMPMPVPLMAMKPTSQLGTFVPHLPIQPTTAPSGMFGFVPSSTAEPTPPAPPKSLMSLQLHPPGTTPAPFPKTAPLVEPPAPVMTETIAQEPHEPKEPKLPIALEKMLAFKDERVTQVGMRPEDMERVEKGEVIVEGGDEPGNDVEEHHDYHDDDDNDENVEASSQNEKTSKESKNKKKKLKKKKKKKTKAEKAANPQQKQFLSWMAQRNQKQKQQEKAPEDEIEVEYVPEQITFTRYDATYYEFMRIFDAFKITPQDKSKDEKNAEVGGSNAPKIDEKRLAEIPIKARGLIDMDDEDKPPEVDKTKLSKKKLKKMNRLSVAELKQLVVRPDVVEMHDVTSRDPKLLVHLKGTRNTVTVPRHWCFKRKYLQGKRGIEKPPFDLPDFIKATGIMEMRQALQDKEDQKTLKAKMRERVRPKMGKIDIDYQKLHDAFFKWQTKPKMSMHGELYYEGKEFETRLKEKKPGNLSDDLRTALGMPIGANCEKYPPPWLIAMQRYGPPPSYPTLKISGLTAPIPEGCSFGYHAGGWGKPPVDELGKPLYGDVFGPAVTESQTTTVDEEIDRSYWGELESESSEEESEEEDEERELESGLVTPGETGLVTPSGVTSVPVGVETPDMIELRKRRIEDAMEQGGDTPAAPYTILPEKKASVAGAMMGSSHVYDIAAAIGRKAGERVVGAEGIEVALNPEELDLDTAAMQAKYEQTVREQQSQLEKEDLSDMVAEHAAKQQKKRKKQQQQQDSSKGAKKYKEFKF